MDRGPALAAARADSDSVRCEQAVFTSVRSPLGNGYRLLAGSPGLTVDEKRQIVACAPSHGSLCDPSPAATGLVSFPLLSGRWCVLYSRPAGPEPTGRGGLRVWTHVLVLDSAAWARFAFNPLRIMEALVAAVGEPGRDPPPHLPRLSLRSDPPRRGPDADVSRPDATTTGELAAILEAVLEGRRLLVTGTQAGTSALRHVLAATPAKTRSQLSLSCGLRFTPARAAALVLTDGLPADQRPLAEELGLELCAWESLSQPAPSPLDAWLRLARDCWTAGRDAELDALSAELTDTGAPSALAQLAALWADVDRVSRATTDELDALVQRHSRAASLSAAYDGRRDPLVSLVESRRQAQGATGSTAAERTG